MNLLLLLEEIHKKSQSYLSSLRTLWTPLSLSPEEWLLKSKEVTVRPASTLMKIVDRAKRSIRASQGGNCPRMLFEK